MFAVKKIFSGLKVALSTSNSAAKQSPVRNTINVAFGKYLLLTNTTSSGVLMFLGDIAQQEIEYQQRKLPKRYNYGRLCRMFLVGLVLGPVHHYYYNYLNRVMPKRDMGTIGKKILLDQLVMSPICIAIFFYGMGLLEGKNVELCNVELKKKFLEVYTMDWIFWPPAQFFNFYYIPDKYQVFFINFTTMLYNIFLSYIKHRESAEEHAKKILDKHLV